MVKQNNFFESNEANLEFQAPVGHMYSAGKSPAPKTGAGALPSAGGDRATARLSNQNNFKAWSQQRFQNKTQGVEGVSQLAAAGSGTNSKQPQDSRDESNDHHNQNRIHNSYKSDFSRRISPMEAKRGGEDGDQPQSRATRQDQMEKIVDPKQIAQAPLIIQP